MGRRLEHINVLRTQFCSPTNLKSRPLLIVHHEVIARSLFFILCDPLSPFLLRFFLAYNDGRFQLLLFLCLPFWRERFAVHGYQSLIGEPRS